MDQHGKMHVSSFFGNNTIKTESQMLLNLRPCFVTLKIKGKGQYLEKYDSLNVIMLQKCLFFTKH